VSWHTHMESANQTLALDICECQLDLIHPFSMAESYFDEWIAQRYQTLWPELFEPAVAEPTVAFLADLAGTGPALEFGVGTGRIAIPLSQRGVPVSGIELSAAMVAQLGAQSEDPDIDVAIGDFATTKVDGLFRLVYLLRNTITNLTPHKISRFRRSATPRDTCGQVADSLSRTTFLRSDAFLQARPSISSQRRPPILALRSTTSRTRPRCLITTG
jgi:hypothetical protein